MNRLSNLPPGCTDAAIERQVAEPMSRLDDIIRRDSYNRSTGTAACDRRYLLGLIAELVPTLQAVADFWAGGDAPPELTDRINAALAKAGL